MNVAALTQPTAQHPAVAPPLITVDHVRHVYDNGVTALDDVSVQIGRGELIGLVGQNGSGKSTLAKHLNGLLRPTSGQVSVAGLDTRSASLAEIAQHVGFVFQNPDHQIFCSTVREELAFGPRNLGLSAAAVESRVALGLEAFGLEAFADHPPALLGFGLRRKVSLASVLSMRPDVLVLDEPTVGLDWRSALELMAIVERLHEAGHTIVLITHDMRIITRFTTRAVVLRAGTVVADGPTRSVLLDTDLLRATQIEPTQVVRLSAELWPDQPPAFEVDELVQRWTGEGRRA